MDVSRESWSKRGIVRVLAVLALLLAVTAAGTGSRAAGAAEKTPPGDPPGNNGTVKVVASDPSDPDPGNEPHSDSCLIWLEYYGFDQNQTADITFTAQPPSGHGEELIADKSVAISDDPAGGGQDKDAVIAYNFTSAVKNLQRQANQGYHIKLSSDTKEAPGGAKHKVFWINCAPAEATTLKVTKAVQGTGAGPFPFELRCNHRVLDTAFTLGAGESKDVTGVPAGTTCVATETDAKGAARTDVTESPSDDKADGKIKVAGGAPAAMTFTNVFPAAAPPAAQAAGASGQRGAAAATTQSNTAVLGATATKSAPATLGTDLPRTGTDPTPLVAAGLWSLSAGGLALAAGRRRRQS